MAIKAIPGVNLPNRSDLPVMHSFCEKYSAPGHPLAFVHFLDSFSPWVLVCGIVVLYPVLVQAQTGSVKDGPFQVLWRWIPLLITSGFASNVVISFWTMALGTIAGVFLGIAQISHIRPVRILAKLLTQTFRNSPWLVVLFIVMLSIPDQLRVFGHVISFPDWVKSVLALSLPIMANLSEVVRGAIQSLPTSQWEAAEALAFTRHQILWRVILPQCIKRMMPPWMNWYAILTMATPLVSLLGVRDMIAIARFALTAENSRPELLFPFYGFCLVTFFAYCYPIARLTIRLEKRFAVMT